MGGPNAWRTPMIRTLRTMYRPVGFVIALVVTSACTPIRSGLNIPPGEAFLLGGEQRGAFTVTAENVGSVPVSIGPESEPRRLDAAAGPDVHVTIEPGERGSMRFERGQAALFTNLGSKTARLRAVIRSDTPLGMGYLKVDRETYAPKQLGAGAAAEDLRILRQAFEDIHPGYGRYIAAQAMSDAFDGAAAKISDGSTDADMLLLASQLSAMVRCDHTKAELPEAIETYRRETPSHLPFTVRIIEGRMYVDSVSPKARSLERGQEVESINGFSTFEILRDVQALVSVDGWTDSTAWVEMEYSAEYLGGAIDHYWPFLYGWPQQWSVVVAGDGPERRRTQTLNPITYGDWVAVATGDEETSVNFRDTVEFQMLDGATAYLSVGSFINYRNPIDPTDVFDPIFTRIREANASKLILDLRLCGGGSDDVPASLTTYLADTIYPTAKRPPWVRNYRAGDLRPYLSTYDESIFELPDSLFTDLGNGHYQLNQPIEEPRPAPDRDNRFRGQLVVLCGAANASGTTILLSLLQEHYGATLIGAPTGGSREGPTAGVMLTLTLPNSGVRIRIPAMRSWVNTATPYPGNGVLPDIVVNETLDSWKNNVDIPLRAAQALSTQR